MKTEMYMEDAIAISLQAISAVEQGLAKYGIVMSPADEDKVYMPIMNFLENLSNGNYRHEN